MAEAKEKNRRNKLTNTGMIDLIYDIVTADYEQEVRYAVLTGKLPKEALILIDLARVGIGGCEDDN